MKVEKNFIEEMFKHYIELKRKYRIDDNQYDRIALVGQIYEAEMWLKGLGIDLDCKRIDSMVMREKEIRAYDIGKEPEEPWYTEEWYNADLRLALEGNDLPDDEEHMEPLKEACLHIFDDKYERSMMLAEKACELFPPV